MQKFNVEPQCAKCGGKTVSLAYTKSNPYASDGIKVEHLRIQCHTCQHIWKMECKDANN